MALFQKFEHSFGRSVVFPFLFVLCQMLGWSEGEFHSTQHDLHFSYTYVKAISLHLLEKDS